MLGLASASMPSSTAVQLLTAGQIRADTSERLYLYSALLVNSFLGPLMQNG